MASYSSFVTSHTVVTRPGQLFDLSIAESEWHVSLDSLSSRPEALLYMRQYHCRVDGKR